MSDTTVNAYLDGALMIRQPAKGYRAGVDPVLLAASIPAKRGQSVLELGCGVGTAALCLAHRVPGLSVIAVELQSEYAQLAKENAQKNNVVLDVHVADLARLPTELRQKRFDHVIANPPYFDRAASVSAADQGRETAMGEGTSLDQWVAVAAKRLQPRGYATFIHRAERLPDLLEAMGSRLGSLQVMPLQSRRGRDPGLVLVRGRKEGRAAFRLHAPVCMHEGTHHDGDKESYTAQLRAILRDGVALNFPD